MKRPLRNFALAAAAVLLPLASQPFSAAADTPPRDVLVSVSDSGFSPANISVQSGGTVTWLNVGGNVHTASSLSGAPMPFDTGGLGSGQKMTIGGFVTLGTYTYTSETDCLNGNHVSGFDCTTGFTVVVVPAAPAEAPAPAPTSAPLTGPAPSAANVTITDSTFSPQTVTIAAGGTVTWYNQSNCSSSQPTPTPVGGTGTSCGGSVHSVASTASSPIQFNTGGIGALQSVSLSFPSAGTYNYTSGADCLTALRGTFNCGATYSIVVTGSSTAPAAPVSVSAPAAPASASVTITDSGINPETVNVAAGGTVTWTNQGSNVHTATSTGLQPLFDTGGLSNGQSATLTMSNSGSYTYSSATDCLNGNSNPGFACSHTYTVNVIGAPGQAAPTPVTTSSGNVTVTIDDSGGFQPASLVIRAGQTVTWINRGSQTHSVVSNPGIIPSFDSGGLGPGQTFSQLFPAPAIYGYHSSTEPQYTTDPATQSTVVTYKFNGSVSVQ